MKKFYSLLLLLALSFGLSAQVFSANFDDVTGTGGNDGSWSGTVASGSQTTYTTGGTWTLTRVYKGDKCFKMGTSSAQGILTTPALTNLNGDATLTFRAGAWSSASEQTELLLEITGGGTLSVPSVTMVKGAFSNYTVNITGGTATTKITFKGKQAADSRFFIDDVVVNAGGTPVLSSSPNSLSFGSVNTSSTSSSSVVTVTSSNLTVAPTYSVTGTDAAMFTATGTLTTSGGSIDVTFAPTSVGEKNATLTITSGSLTSTVSLTGTGITTGNPFGLVETSPVSALVENFETGVLNSTTMPNSWKNVNEATADRKWEIRTYNSNKYAQMSANSGTGTYSTWLVSPAINLDQINKTSVKFDWNSGYANGAELKVYVLKLNSGVMVKNLVTTINDNVNTTGYGASYSTETLDLSAYSGVGFLAFEYVGDPAIPATTTYQVDNVNITSFLGVKDVIKSKNVFLKNTIVNDALSFETKGNATVKLYNSNGQLVKSFNITPNNKTINVSSLQKGVYIVSSELNGETVSQKIVKQ